MKITATIPQSVVDALLAGQDLALEVAMIAPASPGIDPQPPGESPPILWLVGNPHSAHVAPPRTLEAQGARRISAPGTRHLYSRQAALSDDGALALVMQRDGHFLIVDADGGEGNPVAPSTGLAGGNCDANWHGRFIYAVGNDGAAKGALSVSEDGNARRMFDIEDAASFTYAHSGAEGRPSRDGRRFPFMLHDASFRVLRSVVTDASGKIILAVPNNGDNPNHVTMSPSGRWFIVSRADTGANRGGDPLQHAGTWAYDLAGEYPVIQLAAGSQHSDVCTGKDGRDHFVYADFDATSPHAGKVWYCPIEAPDERTVVLNTYGPNHDRQNNAFHFSGCGPDGWVLASAYGRAPAMHERVAWWDHRIFAIEVSPHANERRVALLADHNSVYDPNNAERYWAEPHACWSRDGSRIIFASNNRGEHEPASYVLDVPVLP